MSPERKMEARSKLDANVQSVRENFKNRDYQRLAFTCICSNCHKRQPWSSYFRISPWKIWSFIAGALFLLCFLRARISLPVVVLWLVFLSLMVPLSIDWIKRVSTLSEVTVWTRNISRIFHFLQKAILCRRSLRKIGNQTRTNGDALPVAESTKNMSVPAAAAMQRTEKSKVSFPLVLLPTEGEREIQNTKERFFPLLFSSNVLTGLDPPLHKC